MRMKICLKNKKNFLEITNVGATERGGWAIRSLDGRFFQVFEVEPARGGSTFKSSHDNLISAIAAVEELCNG